MERRGKDASQMFKVKQEKAYTDWKRRLRKMVYTLSNLMSQQKQHSMPTLKVQVGDADAASNQSEEEHSHHH